MDWWLAAAAAILACGLTLSPVTVASLAALTLIVVCAARGLSGRERTAVLVILSLAIVLRVAAVAALFVSTHPGHLVSFSFDGDGWYMKQRSLWIRNVWLGIPIASPDLRMAFEPYGWTSYIYVLAYLQYWLNPAPYAVHLFNVCCFVAAAALLHRIVRRSYGPTPALIALTVSLFWPTQFMWSVSALKESMYLLLLTAVVYAFLLVARDSRVIRRIAGVVVIVAAAIALNTVRAGAIFITASSFALALAGAFVTRRAYLLVASIVAVAFISFYALTGPPIQTRGIGATALSQLRYAAGIHIGNVRTTGHGYKLIDQRFYSGDSIETMTWDEAKRFVMRAIYSFVAVPLPWELSSRPELLVLPEQLVWYGLVLFAIAGIVEGCRRDVLVTWLFIGMIVAGGLVIAPNEGNIGTMVRHRDSIVPFVACLSALGGFTILARLFGVRRTLNPVPTATPAQDDVQNHSLIRRMAASSYLCSAVAALFRPSLGYASEQTIDFDRRAHRALASAAQSSRVVSGLEQWFHAFGAAWRDAGIGRAVIRIRMLDLRSRFRVYGGVLLTAILGAVIAAPFGDAARPSFLVALIAVTCSIGLIIGAGWFAAAVRYRPDPSASTR
jgi:hypothetical protein